MECFMRHDQLQQKPPISGLGFWSALLRDPRGFKTVDPWWVFTPKDCQLTTPPRNFSKKPYVPGNFFYSTAPSQPSRPEILRNHHLAL